MRPDAPALLTRAERALTRTVLMPFAMLLPTVLVLAWFDHGDTVWDGVYSFVVAPVIVVGLALIVPFGFAYQGFGIRAYQFDLDERETVPIDWTAPGWARIRAAVAETGHDLADTPAISTFAVKANLRVLHRPRQMTGRWGRLSDWSARRHKVLIGAGALVGIGAGVLENVSPGWSDAVYPALVVAFLLVALPIVALTMPTVVRRNVLRPELVLVVPSQWKSAFRKDPAASTVLLGHELSHAFHRDALHRRLLAPYKRFAPILGFIDSGIVFTADLPDLVQLLGMAGMTWAAVWSVRHAGRALVVVQELRADAEAVGPSGQADILVSSLERLGGDTVSPAQVARLASLRGAGPVATLSQVRRTVSICNLGFVLPAVLIVLGVISGLISPDVETIARG